MRVRKSEAGFWEIGSNMRAHYRVRSRLNQRRLCGTTEAILRANGIDYFEERKSIEIGVAGANSPDAVFTHKDGSVRVVE